MAAPTLALLVITLGAVTVIVELAWYRTASVYLGGSASAAGSVVGAVMAGLALGGFATARWFRRVARPARWLAGAMVAAGIASALLPALSALLPRALAPIYDGSAAVFVWARLALVWALLLPVSFGLGAALPLAIIVREEFAPPTRTDGVSGTYYALSAIGGVAGSVVGAFLMLPRLGTAATLWVCGAASIGSGAWLWAWAGRFSAKRSTQQTAPAAGRTPRAAIVGAWMYGGHGAVVLLSEIAWARAWAARVDASVYGFSALLTVVVGGMALGSAIMAHPRWSRHDASRWVVWGPLVVAIAIGASSWALGGWVGTGTLATNLVLGSAAVAVPAVAMGGLFPVVARLWARPGPQAGWIFGANALGSTGGALAGGVMLAGWIDTAQMLALAVSLSAGLAMIGGVLIAPKPTRKAMVVVGAAVAVGAIFWRPDWTPPLPDGERAVYHREGATSQVTVSRRGSNLWMRLDGKVDASNLPPDMMTQTLLGHVPFLFAPSPQNVAVIGFGSGVTSHAVLTHPVSRVDNLEIEARVIEAAEIFSEVNGRPLDDPRSTVVLGDARASLLYRPHRYDIIISEPSNPWMAGVNRLFTREFYDIVRQRLATDGVFCQWLQRYDLSAETLQSLVDTVAAAFPHAHLFASHLGSDVLLVASTSPLQITPAGGAMLERDEVAAHLRQVGVTSLADLAVLYSGPVRPPAASARLNTDDNGWVEYRAPLERLDGGRDDHAFPIAGRALLSLFFPDLPPEKAMVQLGLAAARRKSPEAVAQLRDALLGAGAAEDAAVLDEALRALQIDLDRRLHVDQLLAQAERHVLGRPTRSAALVREAIAVRPRTTEQNVRLGTVASTLGWYAEAEQAFDLAVGAGNTPYRYQALAGRGAMRVRLGLDGSNDLKAAKDIDPTGAAAYVLLALALHDMGRSEQALAELRRGLAVLPRDTRLLTVQQHLK